ncbi:MAG: hypothetical protein AB7J19_10220, partial [Beijerinckiaceae bacterium]
VSQNPDGTPASFASVPGEAWHAPHREWIRRYRGLFERAASHIADAPDFFADLAYIPHRLLPGRDGPRQPDDVLQAILELNVMLLHRLEAWVTKRTVVETTQGGSASQRLKLVGSDASSFANLLPRIVGAWESLLDTAPILYRWPSRGEGTDAQRWEALRGSWPFLWQHLRSTAYMLAVAVWNEDEIGTALLRDALVRWPQGLQHNFHDQAYLLQRRLLFPDILSLDFASAQMRIKPLMPEHMPTPTPDELFNATLQGAHDDAVLLTAALLLFWSMEGKQVRDIGAKTALGLLQRELEDPREYVNDNSRKKTFASLMMDVLRLEVAGERWIDKTYGAELDSLVEALDNMTERQVVPGRVFTPSTVRYRSELRTALLVMLLAFAPEQDDVLVKRISDLAKNEAALPSGDRSLRDVLHNFERICDLLATPGPSLHRGLGLMQADVEFSIAAERTKSIITTLIAVIQQERTERLRAMPFHAKAIDELRDTVDAAMTTSPGGIFFFRGFPIEKGGEDIDGQIIDFQWSGISKAQFVNPPMEQEISGFTKNFARRVTDKVGNFVWGAFTRRPREQAAICHRVDHAQFWEKTKELAANVGAEPLLIVSRNAEGRTLRQFVHQLGEPPSGLTIERKSRQDMGNSYIATVEGIDVYGADFEPNIAWLFSPHILRSVTYPIIEADQHITRISFRLKEDLTGSIIVEFKQITNWADWPVYEIRCNDPKDIQS